MKEIIFEKVYDTPCTDNDDLDILGNFSHNSPLFAGYDNDTRCKFSRLASQNAIFAEAFGGKLTVFFEKEKIVFLVETNSVKITDDILKMINNLALSAEVEIASQDNSICIKATYIFYK